jgi:hypothetical protein
LLPSKYFFMACGRWQLCRRPFAFAYLAKIFTEIPVALHIAGGCDGDFLVAFA